MSFQSHGAQMNKQNFADSFDAQHLSLSVCLSLSLQLLKVTD